MIKWRIWKEQYTGDENCLDVYKKIFSSKENYYNYLKMMEDIEVHHLPRKLRANFSLEAAQDINVMHGIDLEKELTECLSKEIENEIMRELIEKIKGMVK